MKISEIMFYLTQRRRKQPRATGAESLKRSLYLANKQKEIFNLVGEAA